MITKQIIFPVTTKQYLIVIIASFLVFAWIYASNTQTPLQVCQESYMKATNEISQYNMENPKYKLALPIYDCSFTWTASLTPASEVPPKWKVDYSEDCEKIYWKKNNLCQLLVNLDDLHKKVCDKQINSPLCKDRKLFDRLYHITEERLPNKQFFPILIGITNAESSLWLNFARDKVGWTCVGRNNWGWTKYKINDDNTRTHSRNLNWFLYWSEFSWKYVDQYGCNLYPFNSIEEYWTTKVNWMRYWYKGCVDSPTPVKCLSYKYVWDPNISEKSWVNNVSKFL